MNADRAISGQKISNLKTRFIINPRSGHAARYLPALTRFIQETGGTAVHTERPRHAYDLAVRALAEGCALIVAVGGDGTLNEVGSALVGTTATLGLVSCGSGNGLARHLGIHGSPAHAVDILRHGRPRLIDSGLADGHPFFNVAGFGFEAEIAQRFNRLPRRGFYRYLTTSAQAFRRWQPEQITIVEGNRRTPLLSFTLVVANADQYGNNARIAPGARVDDGQLDLCALPPISWRSAAPLIARLFLGKIQGGKNVTTRRGPHFVIERTSAGSLHTDGESHDAGRRIEFTVRPASLRVLGPA